MIRTRAWVAAAVLSWCAMPQRVHAADCASAVSAVQCQYMFAHCRWSSGSCRARGRPRKVDECTGVGENCWGNDFMDFDGGEAWAAGAEIFANL